MKFSIFHQFSIPETGSFTKNDTSQVSWLTRRNCNNASNRGHLVITGRFIMLRDDKDLDVLRNMAARRKGEGP